MLVSAEGSWMVDTDGKRYLDGVSALEACVAGHIRPELAEAAYRQMQQLEFLDVFRYTSPPAINLAARLAEITPGTLSRVHFTPGGSEAVETAIKIAKQYHYLRGNPNRYKVITARVPTTVAPLGPWPWMAVTSVHVFISTTLYRPLAGSRLPLSLSLPSLC